MRILLIADYYPAYLASFHKSQSVSELTYDAAQDLMLEDYFGVFGTFRNYFRKIGHACDLLIGNDYPQQNKWLAEAGERVVATAQNKQQVVLKQIEAYKPDVIFIGSMFDYYGDFMRKAAAVTRNVFTWISCPHPKGLDFSGIRCVMSSVDGFVEQFRSQGLASAKLDAAFDADIVTRIGPQPKKYQVTFIGGLSRGSHSFRLGMLKELIKQGVSVDLWGYGLDRGWVFPSPLKKHFHGELWGLDYYRILAQSKITLNFHVDVAKTAGFAGNMRTYEATGCGALLLTDSGPKLRELFDTENEVSVYSDPVDLARKISTFLGDDERRERIAAEGQAACHARHGYGARIRDFERILAKYSV